MLSKLLKRAAAGVILAGGLLLAAPAIAAADTLVYTGTDGNGGFNYINANTGLTFTSATYLGATYDTCKVAEQ